MEGGEGKGEGGSVEARENWMMARQIDVMLATHAGGAHVEAYLAALGASPDCGRVTLCDPDGTWHEAARAKLGERLQRVERELAPLLAERPELALVSYEARLAPGVIEAALEAGCHVLAEKPGCVAVADFARLCQIADSKHRWLMLAFANRSNPEIVAARELVRGGRLGRLYGIELQLVADQTRLTGEGYRRQWFAQKSRAGGGHLAWLGIHWLDLAMYVTGSRLVTATGLTTNIGGTPLDIEDSAVVAFQLENGILGTLTSGYYLPRGYHSRLQVWGSQGWLRLDPVNERRLEWLTTVGERAGEVIQEPPAATPGGYTPFVGAVCRAVASETEPPVTTAESLRAIEGVFAVYRAAETGTTQRWPGEGAGR